MSDETGADLYAGEQATREQLVQVWHALDRTAIVWVSDAKGCMVGANAQLRRLSQYSEAELIGRDQAMLDSGQRPPAFFLELWQSLGPGAVWTGEIRSRAKDGSLFWLDATIVPLLDAAGIPARHLCIGWDITGRKNAEQSRDEAREKAREEAVAALTSVQAKERMRAAELERAHAEVMTANKRIVEEHAQLLHTEKLSAMGLLAAGVAHEINNPLSGIIGCLRALQDGMLTPAKRDEYFAVVHDGLGRIHKIVQSLLGYAQPLPTMSNLDPRDVIDAVLRLVDTHLRARRLRVSVAIDKGTVWLRGDHALLMQAFLNVITNAVHASKPGATIELSAQRRGTDIGLSVRDHGHGIAAEHLRRVCDPFFTTKSPGEGTGLGLSVTQGIIKAHGGELVVESALGAGTAVTFWLPEVGAAHG